ncbi:MAG: FAD-dependent oxidoreductase [Patescibacteria group bacterium]|nr:FAD-dependent oxidoreductase [Patescibacteria group bacterium]
MEEKFDVIIVGAGAAGLTAALYAARRQLSTVVFGKDLGGQTSTTMDIENYPGIDFSTGPALMNNFADQAKKFGAQIKLVGIADIKKRGEQDFWVKAEDGSEYGAKTIILAFGKHHRALDVSGEKEFRNKGVVYCATCDAPLFSDKTVAVVGGGSAAFDAVLLLTKIAKKIYLVHRRDTFRAEEILVKRAQANDKVELVLNATVQKIIGNSFVTGLVIQTPMGEQTLNVDGVFVEIGSVVGSEFIRELVQLNAAGEIVIDHVNQTTTPGVFAAGDATTVPFKQTVISAGEGAKAALAAYNYIQGLSADTQSADQGYIK